MSKSESGHTPFADAAARAMLAARNLGEAEAERNGLKEWRVTFEVLFLSPDAEPRRLTSGAIQHVTAP